MQQIYAVVAVAGILTVLFDVAYQSYLPSLVERDQIFEGNSKLAFDFDTLFWPTNDHLNWPTY
jgi:hypothetical protein